LIRFEAELPNETWQADITHWRLAGGRDVEILNMVDDHSRVFLASRAFPTAKAADVVEVFRSAIDLHGPPASLLCDNGAVFTATPRGSKVLLQLEMECLGVSGSGAPTRASRSSCSSPIAISASSTPEPASRSAG
jgi:transposase InsO family protein